MVTDKFNGFFGEVFKLPEPYILESAAVVPGIDGQKMSKSYDNTIGIFEPGKLLKKKIMSIKTDSTPMEEPKDPSRCNVFAIFRLFADDDERADVENRYREGGIGYGEVKKRLLALVLEHFREARERRAALEADPDVVRQALERGAERARASANPTLSAVRQAVGA